MVIIRVFDYFLKESFLLLSGKHTEGKARIESTSREGIIVQAENDDYLYFSGG